MRLFTAIVSASFVAGGVWMIVDGTSLGWPVTVFFGLCFLVALFEPWIPKPRAPEYRLVITDDEVACEHAQRPRESIRWEDVDRIWYVTTPYGPLSPDEWLLLEGERGACSFPTEAKGMGHIWDELTKRFAGFDYGPVIEGGAVHAKHLCWERKQGGHP